MRWQTTAILAVVLLALGAFYYVYEIRGGPERAKVEAQKGRLWTVDAADVVEVELRRGAEVVTLKRETDGWRLLGPVTARGDRGKVDETLTTLTTARVDREIESAPTPRRSPPSSTSSGPPGSRSSSPSRRNRWPPTAWRGRSASRSTRAGTRTARPRRSSSGAWTGRSRASTPCGPASPRCCCCPPRRGRSCRRTSRCSGTRSSWRSTGTR